MIEEYSRAAGNNTSTYCAHCLLVFSFFGCIGCASMPSLRRGGRRAIPSPDRRRKRADGVRLGRTREQHHAPAIVAVATGDSGAGGVRGAARLLATEFPAIRAEA